MLIVSILCGGIGLALFAQTQRSLRRRSQRAELASEQPGWQRNWLRVVAGLMLALAWYCAAQPLGAQLGSLFWVAELGVIGLLLTVMLALRHAAIAPQQPLKPRQLCNGQQRRSA